MSDADLPTNPVPEGASTNSRSPARAPARIVPIRGGTPELGPEEPAQESNTSELESQVDVEHIRKQKKKFRLRLEGLLHPGLVPTPLLWAGERPPLEIRDVPRVRLPLMWMALINAVLFVLLIQRNKIRTRIDGFLRRIGKLDDAGLRARERARAEAIREFCSHRGGIWVKGAQLVAARRDLISDVLSDILDSLHDRAPGFPPKLALEQLAKALGCPIDEVFSEFETEPLAAATIGQVHRARLRGEDVEVVVKIKRPGIEEVFRRDLSLLKAFARFCTKHKLLPQLRIDELYDELYNMINDELDYRIEAHSGKVMRKLLVDHRVYAPKVYRDYSNADVLVMECVHGVLMSDFLRIRNSAPARARAWCEENDIKPKRVSMRLFESFQRQMLESNLFHADMHPGNVMLLRNSRIALIDFGSTGKVDAEFLGHFTRYQRLQLENRYRASMDLYLHLLGDLPPIDKEKVIRDLTRTQMNIDYRATVKSIPYAEKATIATNGRMLKILGNYKIPPAHELTKLNRTFFAVESTLLQLVPSTSLPKLYRRYYERREVRMRLPHARERIVNRIEMGAYVVERAASVLSHLDENFFYWVDRMRIISKAMATRGRVIGHGVLTLLSRAIGLTLLVGLLVFLHRVSVRLQADGLLPGGFVGDVMRALGSFGGVDYVMWSIFFFALLFAYLKLRALSRWL